MSAQPNLTDAQRERLIKQAFDRMCATASAHERQTAWDAMRALVCGRSGARVRQIERERGLA